MKSIITVGGVDQPQNFVMTSMDVAKIITANQNNHDVVNKSNINYEIEIISDSFASFVPFKGLGNGWGTRFGFTFGCGDYNPGHEVYFQNGLFAMAEFFKGISWVPFENMSDTELSAVAAEQFCDRIASDLRRIAIEVGRPVFPLSWSLESDGAMRPGYGVEQLTITVTPRLAPALYTPGRDFPELRLTPREVISALVFYTTARRMTDITIGKNPRSVLGLMKLIGVDVAGKSIDTIHAEAFTAFADRWPRATFIDTDAEAALHGNAVIEENVAALLESELGTAAAALEIIHLFDFIWAPEEPTESPAE